MGMGVGCEHVHTQVKLGLLMLWDIFLGEWKSHLQVSCTFLSTCQPTTTNCGYKLTGKYTQFKIDSTQKHHYS